MEWKILLEIFDQRIGIQNLPLMDVTRDSVGRAIYEMMEKELESRSQKYGEPVFAEVVV
ncbi:MAG: hypothetical protein IPJ69_09905 [Deltaproteobacteria bacterium]|nr:MAG: hypothetical protein IPJ69_09905 [Deltaproteobacteria bacterium]